MSLLEPADESSDAIRLLTAEHEEMASLFERYRELAEADAPLDERVTLATQICFELLLHAQIEEEILYPAASGALDDPELIDEARAEHDNAKETMVRLEAIDPADEHYDATVMLLAEIVDHHVREEEGEMFPRLQDSDLDLDELGVALAARRQELFDEVMADMGDAADE